MEYKDYPCKPHFDITRPVGEVFKDKKGKLIRVNAFTGSVAIVCCCSCCYVAGECFTFKTRSDGTRGECGAVWRYDATQIYYSEVKMLHINFMEE